MRGPSNRLIFPLLAAIFLATISGGTNAVYANMDIAEIHGLKSLSSCRVKLNERLSSAKHLRLYHLQLKDNSEIFLLAFPVDGSLKLAVHMTSRTAPTATQAKEARAVAAVNGGYFNLSDGVSASYVVVGGSTCADPKKNRALTGNPKLQEFLPQIYDRSELRILKDKKGNTHYSIARHEEALPAGMTLVDSLQGGPRLLPELMAEKEAFVRRDAAGETTDSIGVMRTAARTAVALTDDGHVLVVSVAGKKQSEFSAGLDLATLAKLLKNLGAREALNFDGGTSTTMVLQTDLTEGEKAHADGNFQMLVGLTPETLVKSTLCIVESKE